MEERLQKILARAGYGSRRACEELISAHRVQVNGKPADLGQKADPQADRVTLDGKLVNIPAQAVYIALNKPVRVLSDEQEADPRPSARDLVDVEGHLFPVGRLDYDSEGLLLLTSDGELANRLTHPRYQHEKEYRVLVAARPDERQIAAWRRGIVLEDGSRTLPARVDIESAAGEGAWMRIVLKEGKKRQIREVGRTIGLPVMRIIRIRIGTLLLGTLKPGQWRRLNQKEIAELKKTTQGNKAAPGQKPGQETTRSRRQTGDRLKQNPAARSKAAKKRP